jgi:cell division protein ZapA
MFFLMGELSIKIKIGEREYPMRVSASEEEKLRIAGRLINQKMKDFKEAFGIDDRQDLLAMVAFDCMVEKLKSEDAHTEFSNEINGKMKRLDGLFEVSFPE